MARANQDRAAERLTAPLAAAVEGVGLVLEDVTVQPAGKRRIVRVVVDLPDDREGALSLDDVAEASRAVSAALDEADAMGAAPYVLEVTSPGVDRPLTEPRHFRRNRGRLVELTGADGTTTTGRVVSADDQVLVLRTDDGEQELAWAEVGRARVRVEFRRDDADASDQTDDQDDQDDQPDQEA